MYIFVHVLKNASYTSPKIFIRKEKNDFKVCQNIEGIAIGRKRRVEKSKPCLPTQIFYECTDRFGYSLKIVSNCPTFLSSSTYTSEINLELKYFITENKASEFKKL
jgi:hypothetical protein